MICSLPLGVVPASRGGTKGSVRVETQQGNGHRFTPMNGWDREMCLVISCVVSIVGVQTMQDVVWTFLLCHAPGRVGCWGGDSSLGLGDLFILKPSLGTFLSPPVHWISLPSILYTQTGPFQADRTDPTCQTETRVVQRWLKSTQPGFPSPPSLSSTSPSTCVSLPQVEPDSSLGQSSHVC